MRLTFFLNHITAPRSASIMSLVLSCSVNTFVPHGHTVSEALRINWFRSYYQQTAERSAANTVFTDA